MSLLPIPSINFFPSGYDKTDPKLTALSDKIDSIFTAIENETFQLAWLKQPEKCPAKYLDELGYMYNAGLLQSDSDRTKRQKISSAIASHKIRGSWVNHAKIIIDAITGYSAVIFRGADADDFILCGDGVLEAGTDWAILGGDGTSPYGFSLIGSGSEVEIPGNIYINLHPGIYTAVLSSDQIAQIVLNIAMDIVPAYMIVYLGYLDSTGSFIVYSGGTIS